MRPPNLTGEPLRTGEARTPDDHQEWISVRAAARVFARRPRTIALGLVLGLALAAFSFWSSTPVYRASAVLLLDGSGPEGGELGRMAALLPATSPTGELAILRSRPLVEETVRPPDDGGVPSPAHPEYSRRIGLTTVVQDRRYEVPRTIWNRLFGRGSEPGRLFAVVDESAPGAPRSVLVEFPRDGRVRIGTPARWSIDRVGAHPQVIAYRPGASLEYRGLRLRLEHEGNVTDGLFEVHSVTEQRAIADLAARIDIAERERGSGVIQVTVDDSDPARAADTANALAANYLAVSSRRDQRRADATIAIVQGLLAQEELALEEAQRELVQLKEEHPEAIDVPGSTQSLIVQMREFAVLLQRSRLAREELEQIVERLQNGEVEALSRAGRSLDEPIAAHFLDMVATLTADYALLGRSDTGPYREMLQTRLFDYRGELAAAERRLRVLEQVVVDLEASRVEGLAGVAANTNPAAGVLSDPITKSYLARYAELIVERNELAGDELPTSPRMRAIAHSLTQIEEDVLAHLKARRSVLEASVDDARQIVELHTALLTSYPAEERAEIESALEVLQRQALDHLWSRLAGLSSEEARLQGQLDELNRRLGRLPASEYRLAKPKRDVEVHSETVQRLRASLQEARISRASTGFGADLIEPAEPPASRHSPRTSPILALGALSGLLLGYLLALVHERLRDVVYEPEDLARALGAPTLAALPATPLPQRNAARVLALRDDPGGAYADAIRVLRGRLRFAFGAERPVRVLGLVACEPGEGGAECSANLALALAAAGERVLLVDADLRAPSLHGRFGLPCGPGLAETLVDGAHSWKGALHAVAPGADVLAAGTRCRGALDALSGPRLGTLLQEWRADYDVVLVALPPLLPHADAESLVHRLDGLLVVHRATRLPRRELERTALRLAAGGAPLLGGVLVAARPTRGAARNAARATDPGRGRPQSTRGESGLRKSA